jgi:hypothetical protein
MKLTDRTDVWKLSFLTGFLMSLSLGARSLLHDAIISGAFHIRVNCQAVGPFSFFEQGWTNQEITVAM